jgi:hypothetical protein
MTAVLRLSRAGSRGSHRLRGGVHGGVAGFGMARSGAGSMCVRELEAQALRPLVPMLDAKGGAPPLLKHEGGRNP